MKRTLDNLADLIKVKTLVTLALVAVFCAMALCGRVAEGTVTQTVLMVVAFYFGVQHEKGVGGATDGADGAGEPTPPTEDAKED